MKAYSKHNRKILPLSCYMPHLKNLFYKQEFCPLSPEQMFLCLNFMWQSKRQIQIIPLHIQLHRALINTDPSGGGAPSAFLVTVSTVPEADTITMVLFAETVFCFSAIAAQTATISSLSKS